MIVGEADFRGVEEESFQRGLFLDVFIEREVAISFVTDDGVFVEGTLDAKLVSETGYWHEP